MATAASFNPSLDDPVVQKYLKAKGQAAPKAPGYMLAPSPDYAPRVLGTAPTPPVAPGDFRGMAMAGLPPLTPPPPTTYGNPNAGMRSMFLPGGGGDMVDTDPAIMAWRARNAPNPGPVGPANPMAVPGAPTASAPMAASSPTASAPPPPIDPARVNDAYVRRLKDADQSDFLFRKYMSAPYKDSSPENMDRLEQIRGLNRENTSYQDSLQGGASGQAAAQELDMRQRMRMAGTDFGIKQLAQARGTQLAQGAAAEGQAKLQANIANDPATAAAIQSQLSSEAKARASQAGGEEKTAGAIAQEKSDAAFFTAQNTSEKDIVEGAAPEVNMINSGMESRGRVRGDYITGSTESHDRALSTFDANRVSPLERVARMSPVAASRVAKKLLAQLPVTDSNGQYHGVASAVSGIIGLAGNTGARDAYVDRLNNVRARLEAMARGG